MTISNPTDEILNQIECENFDLVESELPGSFPIEAMPKKMQSIINDVSEAYSFNKDFITCSFLAAVSVAIGATYKVKVKGAWCESALIFLMLVGRPGTNKTAPVNYAFKPIDKQDTESYLDYKRQLAEFRDCQNAKSAENAKSASIDKPRRIQKIISDATLEALCFSLSINKRGLILKMDEIAGWFKNLNRYSKGSDIEFYLQVFSNNTISVNRKNDDSILIDNPFLSLVGTIQPSVLKEIFKDGREENGFIDRVLFCYPTIKNTPSFHWNEPKENSSHEYHTIINRLLALDFNNNDANILIMNDDAKNHFQQWVNQQRVITEGNNNDKLSGIFAKLEVYVFRFALIYQLLAWACNEADKFEVEEDAMISAIHTVEYFKTQALKVNPINQEIKIPLDQQRLSIYQELPKEFKTGEGLEISKKHEMNDRTFKNWLNDEVCFIKITHGNYKKAL